MKRICAGFLTAIAASLVWLGGCAATPNSKNPESSTIKASGVGGQGDRSAGRNILPNTDNGLEVRKWSVVDQPGLVLNAVTRHMEGVAVDEDTRMRLERNGFRFARVPMDRVDVLLEDLGGAGINLNEWHGQAPDWRPLRQRSIGPTPRAIAIDGKVDRHDFGMFAIDLRSWTVQMEDGPFIHVEVVPRLTHAAPNDLRRLLGDDAKSRDGAFASMVLDLQLESGYAYVLFGESPQSKWPANADGDVPATTEAPALVSPARRSGKGPADFTDAEMAAPVTLGEFLLVGDKKPAMRGVIVLVPKIAPELFPPNPVGPEETPVQASKPDALKGSTRESSAVRREAGKRPTTAAKRKGS